MSAQALVAFAAHLGGLPCQSQPIVALDKFDLLQGLRLPYIGFGHIDQLLGKLVGIEAFATAEGDPFGRQTYGCYVLGDERKGQCIASGLIEQTSDELFGGINLQDMFPESLASTGLAKKGSILYRIGEKVSAYAYRNATEIMVISHNMKDALIAKGVPADKISGLKDAVRLLENIEDIAICRLTASDVVRHALVQKIIAAYESGEKKQLPNAKKVYRKKDER